MMTKNEKYLQIIVKEAESQRPAPVGCGYVLKFFFLGILIGTVGLIVI
jgi:hypothetical protein